MLRLLAIRKLCVNSYEFQYNVLYGGASVRYVQVDDLRSSGRATTIAWTENNAVAKLLKFIETMKLKEQAQRTPWRMWGKFWRNDRPGAHEYRRSGGLGRPIQKPKL